MQVDQNPFVHTLELRNPKVLVRPSHAATKEKKVLIGDERSEKKLTLKKAPPAPAKVSTLGGARREKEDQRQVNWSDWF